MVDYTYGARGIISSLDDLEKWIKAIDGNLYISPDMTRKIFFGFKTNKGDEIKYGYGWNLSEYMNSIFYYHSGGWVGFRTFVVNHPKEKLWVVVLANSSGIIMNLAALEMTKYYLNIG